MQNAIDSFRGDGHVRLNQVLDRGLVERVGKGVDQAVARRRHRLHTTKNTRKSYTQMFNVWADEPGVHELTFNQFLGRTASALLDVRGVRLIHDQALLKEPGDRRSIWHRDQFYWPIGSDRTCSIWIPFQETSLEMGPVSFASGSQVLPRDHVRRDPLNEQQSDRSYHETILSKGFPVAEEPFSIGDVSIHAGWTLHQAGPNTTTRCRRALVLHLMEEQAPFAAPCNPEQEDHVEIFRWESLTVGEPIELPSCPVVYRSDDDG